MSIQLTFLGTGTSSGVPMIACDCIVCQSEDTKDKRLRSAVLVEADGQCIVIDTGPDFRQQMLRERVQKLDAVLFTHAHMDHTAGLDDVRAFNFKWKKDMEVYADAPTIKVLKRQFEYVFAAKKYPGVPLINLTEINPDEDLEINGLSITPIKVMHHKMPVLGFRIGDIVYITDANYIAEAEMEKIKGCKLLILNALRHRSHISHFTLSEAVDLVKLIKPEKAYFTHISHQLGLHEEISKSLEHDIYLAYDGLKVCI